MLKKCNVLEQLDKGTNIFTSSLPVLPHWHRLGDKTHTIQKSKSVAGTTKLEYPHPPPTHPSGLSSSMQSTRAPRHSIVVCLVTLAIAVVGSNHHQCHFVEKNSYVNPKKRTLLRVACAGDGCRCSCSGHTRSLLGEFFSKVIHVIKNFLKIPRTRDASASRVSVIFVVVAHTQSIGRSLLGKL